KVFSNFAEARTYRYHGREIDTQVHVGFDLASTKQAVIPAANKGVVVYAGPLTIYGNAVILDHGLGLQTLYGHLSSIAVKLGDSVAKGQELGRSGATGLALGDHLHYEVLVHGVSVTPIEWWDPKWIRDRVSGPPGWAGAPEGWGVGGHIVAPMFLETSELLVGGQRQHSALDRRPHLVLRPDQLLAAGQHLGRGPARNDHHAVEVGDDHVAQRDAHAADRQRLAPVAHAPARHRILRRPVAHERGKPDPADVGGVARRAVD